MNWCEYFTKERQVRTLVRRSGVTRPRIAALTAQLLRPRRSSEPGLLAAATTPDNVRAIVAAREALEARLAPDDLARIKDALK